MDRYSKFLIIVVNLIAHFGVVIKKKKKIFDYITIFVLLKYANLYNTQSENFILVCNASDSYVLTNELNGFYIKQKYLKYLKLSISIKKEKMIKIYVVKSEFIHLKFFVWKYLKFSKHYQKKYTN